VTVTVTVTRDHFSDLYQKGTNSFGGVAILIHNSIK
jgi:hypothetical protein